MFVVVIVKVGSDDVFIVYKLSYDNDYRVRKIGKRKLMCDETSVEVLKTMFLEEIWLVLLSSLDERRWTGQIYSWKEKRK